MRIAGGLCAPRDPLVRVAATGRWLRKTSPAPCGAGPKIHRAGFAFVPLIQPAFRLGIAPLPFDRSVEASTYSRALVGARENLRGRGHQVNTSRQRFVAICADDFFEAIQTLSS